MKSNAIYSSLAPMGFITAGQLCMGSWRGYTVQLRPYNGQYYYLDVAVRVDKRDKSLSKNLRRRVKELSGKGLGCVNGGSHLSFVVSFNKKSPYQEQFENYMQAISSALRQEGISPADSCAVCGGGTPDSLCFYDSSYQPVHSACIRSSLEQARQDIEQNKLNGSYLTGFIGAFLGMIVGSLPSIFTIVVLEQIFAVLFALVPMVSAYGYRKFNGRMDKLSVVFVVLLSFVSVIVMQFVSTVILLMGELPMDAGEALALSAQLLLNLEGLMLIITSSGSLFLFMLLGIFIAWRSVIQTNSGSLKNLEGLGSTLRPNPAYSPESDSNSYYASESTSE